MTARTLEHYNIRSTRFKETVAFYTEVLGLRNGHYPGKVLPGAWIYDVNDIPVIHIVDLNPFDLDVMRKADASTVPRSVESLFGSGAIDHLAFACVDYVAFVQRLEQQGIDYKHRDMMAGLRQLYLMDPNGILIELNFREMGGVS